mmetsp:Transcript_69213/g.109995  ORF Transcript_69213/g.109995 Transcript_69213/m.109995 type:complete len:703 (+) Transcript_69213:90-2198(+)
MARPTAPMPASLTKVPSTPIRRCISSPSPSSSAPSSSPSSISSLSSSRRMQHRRMASQYKLPQNKESFYYLHLVQITLIHQKSKSFLQRTHGELQSILSNGWNIVQHRDHCEYRLKPKYQQSVIFHDIKEAVLYSFNKLLDLHHHHKVSQSLNEQQANVKDKQYLNEVQWVYNAYLILIKALTLEQKAMLFCKCSNRKTRKYKLIHEHKDCVTGKQSVDFLLHRYLCKNRKAAVDVCQELLDKGFMCHVGNKHSFKDSSNLWYQFDDDAIQHANQQTVRYPGDREQGEQESILLLAAKASTAEIELDEDTDADSEKEQDENDAVSSDEEDNNFMLSTLEMNSQQNAPQRLNKLGKHHNTVIAWLLSLYSATEMQRMMNEEMQQLIISPNLSLYHSEAGGCNDDGCIIDSSYSRCSPSFPSSSCSASLKSEDDSSISYHGHRIPRMSNKYLLNIRPFAVKDISAKQRQKLIHCKRRKFECYTQIIEFVLCELWDIYNHQISPFYLRLLDALSLVEQVKMLSLGVVLKNRWKNIKLFNNCFVGKEAVQFLLNSKLAQSKKEAVYLGNVFYKKKWLKHVRNENVFEDKEDLFYVFLEDEIENRLDELKSYRKQQASNQVKLSLDIVTSPKHSPMRIPAECLTRLLCNDHNEDSDEVLYDYRESATSAHSHSPHYSSLSVLQYLSQRSHRASSLEEVESYFDEDAN